MRFALRGSGWAPVRIGGAALGAAFVVHVLVGAAPGDAAACGDLSASPGFAEWLGRLARADLGRPCYGPAGTVGGLLGPAALRTAGLVLAALAMALTLALPLAKLRLDGRGGLARVPFGLSVALGAVPAFLLAYWAATGLNLAVADCRFEGRCPSWFPLQAHASWLRAGVAALVLGVGSGASVDLARGLAQEVERARRADWVILARSTGAGGARVFARALAAPVARLLLARAAALLAGVVVVEAVLGVRGLGTVTWEAARFRDLDVLLAATLIWGLTLGSLRLGVARLERGRTP